jgi:hypothetical protein
LDRIPDETVAARVRAFGGLLPSKAEQPPSAMGRLEGILLSPVGALALLALHGFGIALWIANDGGSSGGVPTGGFGLATLLSSEAVLLCVLVLAR